MWSKCLLPEHLAHDLFSTGTLTYHFSSSQSISGTKRPRRRSTWSSMLQIPRPFRQLTHSPTLKPQLPAYAILSLVAATCSKAHFYSLSRKPTITNLRVVIRHPRVPFPRPQPGLPIPPMLDTDTVAPSLAMEVIMVTASTPSATPALDRAAPRRMVNMGLDLSHCRLASQDSW
jgi:hypothetical protein